MDGETKSRGGGVHVRLRGGAGGGDKETRRGGKDTECAHTHVEVEL